MEIHEMKNKRISSVEIIKAEYGRTYDKYICIVFDDNEKIMLDGGIPYKPNPNVEEMKKAPLFFSAEDIANKVLELEKMRRANDKEIMERKKREYEQLKKELGE